MTTHQTSKILAAVLALSLFGCGKKVVNPSKLPAKQGAEQSGDANASGKTGTQNDIDDLKDLLEKEREERIRGDADLQMQIDSLVQSLLVIAAKITIDINNLDKLGKETKAQLIDFIKESDELIIDLGIKIKAGDDALAQQLKNEFNLELQKLRDELSNATNDQRVEIEKLIANLELKLTLQNGVLAADLRAELATQIKKVEKSMDAFRAEVAVTYATKAELQVLAVSVEGVKNALVVMTKKFDGKLADLSAKIYAEHQRDVADLQAQIDGLSLNVTNIANNITTLERTLNIKISKLRQDITLEMSALSLEINQLQKQDALQIAAIKTLSVNLQNRTEFLFKFFTAIVIELNNKIVQLEKNMEQVSDADRQFYRNQIIVLEKKITALAEEERQARLEIEKKLGEIVRQIQTLELFAQENRGRILANRDNIEKNAAQIERNKLEFHKEIEILRNEFSARLDAVKQTAITITTTLGINVQQQFININAQLAVINQRITSQIRLVVFILADLIGRDPVKNRPIENFLSKQIPLLANDLKQIGFDRVLLENEIVNIISPFAPAAGVNPDQLNAEFRQILVDQNCGGFLGEGDIPAALANKEWFMHIAGEYSALMASGIRSGNAGIDGIFFGFQSQLSQAETISHSIIAAALASYSTGTNCERAVTSWAKSTFLGSDSRAIAIRKAIAESAKIKALALKFANTVAALETVGGMFELDFLTALAAFGKDKDFIRNWLFTPIDSIRPVDRIISYVMDLVEDFRQLAESDANRNRIFSLAKTVATQQQQIGQVTRSVSQLTVDFETLQDRVVKLSQCVTDVKAGLSTLKASQIQAFELIAEIAGRLGFDDIVDRADDEIVNLGGTPGSRVAEGCYGVQHFYNHATNKALPVARCNSLMTTHDSMLSNLELTKCAIHGGFVRGNELVAYTWGNEKLVTNGWSARNGSIGGHMVTDGLLIRQYDPTEAVAMTLANRAEGGVYPADKESTLVYRVMGNADSFKFEVTSEANATKWPYDVTVKASNYLKGQTAGLNIYEIPLPRSISRLGACTWNRRVKITALSKTGVSGANTCEHRFHTFSPIVLNLADAELVNTMAPTFSKVFFDLDGNGISEKTGWITGNSALLARDINKNGTIDDGTELFGEATSLLGKRAENGYAALAHFDLDKNGQIDDQDPIFSELLVWKDINGNGKSEPFELRSAADLGISSIQTVFENVPAAEQLQADAFKNEANLIKYRSTFHMNGCPKAGCASFDVYFGSSEYTTAAK